MALIIAAQACVPISKIGLNYYSGFILVSVYPSVFWVRRNDMDVAGVIHRKRVLLSVESWSRCPVILSWQDILDNMKHHDKRYNVSIHEFRHKIEMLNRVKNGTPPIPCNISEKME